MPNILRLIDIMSLREKALTVMVFLNNILYTKRAEFNFEWVTALIDDYVRERT